MEKTLLTSKEVAEVLNISDYTVRELARENKLEYVKVSRSYRYTLQGVAKFIKQNEINYTDTVITYQNTKLLTTSEVAYLLNCSIYTVQNLAKYGDLPHISFGGRYRFRLEVVNDYITQNTRAMQVVTPITNTNDYSFLYN